MRRIIYLSAIGLGIAANLAVPASVGASAANAFGTCKSNDTRCSNDPECIDQFPGNACVCFPNPVLGPHCYSMAEE